MAVWTDTILGDAAESGLSRKRFLELAAIPGLALFAELLRHSTISLTFACVFSYHSYCPAPTPPPTQTEVVMPRSETAAQSAPLPTMPQHPTIAPAPRPAQHTVRLHHRTTNGALLRSARGVNAGGLSVTHGEPAGTASEPLAVEQAQPRVPIDHGHPVYPAGAQSEGVQGDVLVAYSVDAAGTVHDARILQYTGHGVFNDAALAAVRSWTFMPSAAPTSGRQLRFEFRLKP